MKLEEISSLVSEIPEHWFRPDCPELGDVEELLYGSTYYAGDGSPLLKPCYVYTPYGYDPEDTETRYDIFYFMHGFLCNANSMFEGDDGAIGNIFDWLIYEKKTKPFIAVALTWDYENAIRDFDTSYKQILQFHMEFRQDILPAVESKYHTYAETTDSNGLRASRDHRAFGGYSMGSVTTWQVYTLCGDLCRFYAPLACDSWPTAQFDGAKKPKETAEVLASSSKVFRLAPEDYGIWCGVGDRDQTMMQMIPQLVEMWNLAPEDREPPFNKDNLSLHLLPGYQHGVPACEQLLGIVLPEFFPGSAD